jgi:hypothetical protein
MKTVITGFPAGFARNINMATPISLLSVVNPNAEIAYLKGSIDICNENGFNRDDPVTIDGIEVAATNSCTNHIPIQFPSRKLSKGIVNMKSIPEDVRTLKNLRKTLEDAADVKDVNLNVVYQRHNSDIRSDAVIERMDERGIDSVYTIAKTVRFITARQGNLRPSSPAKLIIGGITNAKLDKEIDTMYLRKHIKGSLITYSYVPCANDTPHPWTDMVDIHERSLHAETLYSMVERNWWEDQVIPTEIFPMKNGPSMCALNLRKSSAPVVLASW